MNPILAIVGPIGSGEHEVAMELARRHGAELISCDSVHVFRGFTIGSGKASTADREEIPHHLLDVVGYKSEFDAAAYIDNAKLALRDIEERGSTPIIYGGTGVFLRALRYGLEELPPKDPELRKSLQAEAKSDLPALVERLRANDPESADTIDVKNPVAVIRAVEIFETTGRPASEVRAGHASAEEQLPMQVVCLRWSDEALRERVAQRVASMLENGLVAEVEGLLAQGAPASCRPMRSVGYREACEVAQNRARKARLDNRIERSAWAYARRQRAWFRKEAGVTTIDVTDLAEAADAIDALRNP